MLEANKFWFYSLLCSVMLVRLLLTLIPYLFQPVFVEVPVTTVLTCWQGCLQLSRSGEEKLLPNRSRIQKSADAETLDCSTKDNKQRIKRRLVTDCLDLLVPGSATGWIPVNPILVGFVSVLSTNLAFKDVWDNISR